MDPQYSGGPKFLYTLPYSPGTLSFLKTLGGPTPLGGALLFNTSQGADQLLVSGKNKFSQFPGFHELSHVIFQKFPPAEVIIYIQYESGG